ncbi:MAG: cation:dicarboxylase symporter family transporter, partial [Mogibacterium sp.]|nr:cation:dicarboxylase symporter family transporter [Mogibacterium sp.]
MAQENLFLRIAAGFVLGIVLGFAVPQFALQIRFLGDIYLNLIKLMVIPVLICAVAGGIINSSDNISLRRVGFKTVVLYIVLFLASYAVSFIVAWILRPGLHVVFENQPVYEGEVSGAVSIG